MTDGEAILVVDDERLDCDLLKLALQWANIHHPVAFVHDARDAVKYFEGQGRFADRAVFPKPGALILDLNLPAMSGLEFLEWLQARPQHKLHPIIMLTMSDRETDMLRAYELGATEYLIKPLTFDELALQIKSTFADWAVQSFAATSA